jgi:hypothetical protein
MINLEKLAYDMKYIAGTYADIAMSIPVATAEFITKSSEKLLKNRNPNFLSTEYTKENSPVYKLRQNLREKLDTQPGVKYIQSNMLGAIPFILAGMPAAELAQQGINKWMADCPEIYKYIANSGATLLAQMATGYTAYFINEVRTNRQKFVDETGKLSSKKIGKELAKTVKAFFAVDSAYAAMKIGGQSWYLYKGKDPWVASGFFDSMTIPIWYGICIPLGLHNRLIVTKKSDELFPEKQQRI